MNKPILCLDFDGVVHQYSKGWQDGTIYDDVTEGFFEWAEVAAQKFKLVIYSSRSKTMEGIEDMRSWYHNQLSLYEARVGRSPTPEFSVTFATSKPPAFVTIDDRAVNFTGNWKDFNPDDLLKFKPWNQV